VLNVGELVIFAGRRYWLRGSDPAGVEPRFAYLEDAKTGQVVQVPLDELKPQRPAGRGRVT
jgi:hypothetical protein